MKKLSLEDLENLSAKGAKLCWGTAAYYAVTLPFSGIGLVLGAACYVASL